MQLVDAAHELQVARAGGPGQVADRASAHAQQAGLARDGQGVITVDHCFALSNPAMVSARSKKSFSSANWPILACSGARSTGATTRLPAPKTSAAPRKQLALPVQDLAGVHLVLLARLGHRLVVTQGGQGNLCLERRTVGAPRATR